MSDDNIPIQTASLTFLRGMRVLLKTLLFFVGTHTVINLKNVPLGKPYILVVNHSSKADSPLLFLSVPVPPYTMRYFAAEKWENHWFYGPFLKRADAIFINRGEVDRKALQQALGVLKNGGAFGLAPEGTRSKTATLMRAKEGAAYLASRSGVPIVPAAIAEADRIEQNLKRLRRTHMTVTFGEPFYLPDLGRRARTKDMAAYTHLIMVKIAELLPERYHGYYADSPALAALKRGEDPFPYCQEAEGISPIKSEKDE